MPKISLVRTSSSRATTRVETCWKPWHAAHSKFQNSANVPVDYVAVKQIRKPNGAKPGFVIYEGQKTVYVTPDKELIKSLKAD